MVSLDRSRENRFGMKQLLNNFNEAGSAASNIQRFNIDISGDYKLKLFSKRFDSSLKMFKSICDELLVMFFCFSRQEMLKRPCESKTVVVYRVRVPVPRDGCNLERKGFYYYYFIIIIIYQSSHSINGFLSCS